MDIDNYVGQAPIVIEDPVVVAEARKRYEPIADEESHEFDLEETLGLVGHCEEPYEFWKQSGITALDVIKAFHEEGILSRDPVELHDSIKASYEALLPNRKWLRPFDPCDPGVFYAALVIEEVCVLVDGESMTSPAPHHDFVNLIGRISRGKFQPEVARQVVHEPGEGERVEQLTLMFVCGEKLYLNSFDSFGDWYNLEGVLPLIDKALKSGGFEERLKTVGGMGQSVAFIVIETSLIQRLGAKYQLDRNYHDNY